MQSILPKSSLCLVTGANGYIGGHVADQLLKNGMNVRGTARSLDKLTYLQHKFDSAYGPGRFQSFEVPELSKPGAFDEALKDVIAVAHVASILSFSSKYEDVVEPVVKGTIDILKSAAKTGNVKRFVLTSSSLAARDGGPGNKGKTSDAKTWNDGALAESKSKPNGVNVYAASKIEGERAMWKFMEQEKPSFTAASILPNLTFGAVLNPNEKPSSGNYALRLYKGDASFADQVKYQWFSDVQDVARLHVAALLLPEVKNERIWAAIAPYTWTQVVEALRKARPDHKFPDVHDDALDEGKIDNKRGEELLREMGRDGWTSLSATMSQNIEHLQ